jgi:hypothetical protein
MVVDVPFAFSAKRRKVPGGTFRRQSEGRDDPDLQPPSWIVRCPLIPRRGRRPMAASSSSDRYGDDYFLSAVWITGGGSGKELFPSGAERELKGKRAAMELAVVRTAQ